MAAPSPLRSSTKVTGPALLPLGHHEGKPPIALLRPVIVVGSRSNARIHLISHTVSNAHALLVRSNGRTYIRDLASRTKVFLNDEQAREAELSDGDVLKIGSFVFKYIGGPGEVRLTRHIIEPLPAKLEIAGNDF